MTFLSRVTGFGKTRYVRARSLKINIPSDLHFSLLSDEKIWLGAGGEERAVLMELSVGKRERERKMLIEEREI